MKSVTVHLVVSEIFLFATDEYMIVLPQIFHSRAKI